jgi:hypothetical protein
MDRFSLWIVLGSFSPENSSRPTSVTRGVAKNAVKTAFFRRSIFFCLDFQADHAVDWVRSPKNGRSGPEGGILSEAQMLGLISVVSSGVIHGRT